MKVYLLIYNYNELYSKNLWQMNDCSNATSASLL